MVEETKEVPAINKEVAKYIELSAKALDSEAVRILTDIIKDKITGKDWEKADKFLEEIKNINQSNIIESTKIDPIADLQANLEQIISIVFYRMKVLMDEQEPLLIQVNKFSKISIITYVQVMCTIIFDKNSSDNMINFYSSLLLHISRTFIETLSKESIELGMFIMLKTINRIKENTSFLTCDNLENETKILVDETDEFLQDIYDSSAYEDSLKELFNEYNLGEDIEKVKGYIKSLDKTSWIWVKDASFQGMIGMKNKIFINLEDKTTEYKEKEDKLMKDQKYKIKEEDADKIMKKQAYKTKLTKLILHEGAHQLLRFVRNDFGSLTPREEKAGMKVENQGMELGYRFEEIIFGSVIIFPDEATAILDKKKWDKKLPILAEEKITYQKKRYYCINTYLSGICAKEFFERFYF